MNALIFKPADTPDYPEHGEVNMNGNVGHNESASHQNRYIRCPDCGEQILMVPDVTQMIEAIETHISTHKDGEYPKHDPIVHPKAPIIREELTEQVLIRAAEIGGTLSRNQTWINTE